METRKRLGDDADADDGSGEDLRGRGDREPHGGDAGAVREQPSRPARPTCRPTSSTALVAMVDKRGWQIFIHAIGDRAIRMSLDAFEHAASVNPAPARGRRHRLEHIEAVGRRRHPALRQARRHRVAAADARAARRHELRAPVRPVAGQRRPRTRTSRAWAWKSIQDAGGRLTFGSDWPVAPLDAGHGIWVVDHAERVRRRRPTRSCRCARRIDGYTRWPAYASFEEQRKGTLAAGMLADIVDARRRRVREPAGQGGRRRGGHDNLRRAGRVRAVTRGTLTERRTGLVYCGVRGGTTWNVSYGMSPSSVIVRRYLNPSTS